MTKSSLPKAQIQFTPSNKLIINYPKPTLEERFFSGVNLIGTIFVIFIFIISIVLMFLNVGGTLPFILFGSILAQLPRIKKVPGIFQITFHSEGLAFANYKDEIEKHYVDNSDFVDFKVKIIDNIVEFNIDKHIIEFSDFKKLPLVIESIANTWNLEYYDTIAVDEHNQILTYRSKLMADEKVHSLIEIDDNDLRITFRDALSSPKFFAVEKATGKLFSHKIGQSYLKLTKNDAIEIEAITKISTSNKCEIRVDIIDIDGKIRTVFVSEKRYEEEEITTYRDTELIYDELKKLPILENVVIEKVFR